MRAMWLAQTILLRKMSTLTECSQRQNATGELHLPCELLAIQFVLSSFSSFLPNSRVKWFTDSQGAVGIVQVGSMNFN